MSKLRAIHAGDGRTFHAELTPAKGTHLALVLPGLRYDATRPLCAQAAAEMTGRGADVLRFRFDYADDPDFMALPDDQALAALYADGAAILSGLPRHSYKSLTFIGKSLGTILMGGMSGRLPGQTATWVWMTPSLVQTGLAARVSRLPGPHFSLIGSRDPSLAASYGDDWAGRADMTQVEVAGMHHGWQHADGGAATAEGLARATEALTQWLDDTL